MKYSQGSKNKHVRVNEITKWNILLTEDKLAYKDLAISTPII